MGTNSARLLKPDLSGILRGDVYEVFNQDENQQGLLFRTVRRNITFEQYLRGKESVPRLNDTTSADGYLIIEADIVGVIGIFVPRGRNMPGRKAIAEAVRSRFGSGSALFKVPSCPGCGFRMEEVGPRLYKCTNCRTEKKL